MATFKELIKQLSDAQGKREIYQHLADHLGDSFLPSMASEPKKVLLTDEKVKVSTALIETVIQELLSGISHLNTQIENIQSAHLAPEVAAPQVIPQEPPKAEPQGEVKP